MKYILFFLLSVVYLPSFSQTRIMIMKIDDVIDPRMNRYTELAFDHATETEAEIVIIEMDTYGGAVNDADDIRTRIMEYPKPVWVFINKDAASAGALISIACDSIYMAKGSSIGAATVVTQDGQQQKQKDGTQKLLRPWWMKIWKLTQSAQLER
jgi:membrane-bound serine protease (ClpP class)